MYRFPKKDLGFIYVPFVADTGCSGFIDRAPRGGRDYCGVSYFIPRFGGQAGSSRSRLMSSGAYWR